MLRDALLYPKAKPKIPTSKARRLLPARFFRPSASCCIYFLISLVLFVLVHLYVVSVVSQETVWSRIPSMVAWDAAYATKLTRKELPNDVTAVEHAEKMRKKSTIHFDDNLPRNDEHIRLQANLTIAKLRTKTANWITPGKKTDVISEIVVQPSQSTTTPTTTVKPATTTTTTVKPATTTRKPPIAFNKDQSMQQAQTLQRTKLYHDRYMKNIRYAGYYNASFKSPLPEKRKAIYLQTNYRSGSTFLGQIFNQHPHVFYTFEPLFLFKDKISALKDLQLDVIKSNLRCNMIPTVDIYKQLKWNVQKSMVSVECLLNNMCFRLKTKGLCDRAMCPTGDRRNSCKACGPLDIEQMNHFCRQHKMTATKVIRLADIGDLKSIIEDPTMDVKVIHLIRDPRGIASSRFRLNKIWNRIGITGTCNRLVKNAQLGEGANSPEWLKGKYMKVRYEDLSRRPMEVASEIYDFVGLEFLPQMKKWINENTHASNGKHTPYSTNRDSAATSEAWRTQLTFEQVKDVQTKCEKALDYFGYKPTWHQDELLNLNSTLVL